MAEYRDFRGELSQNPPPWAWCFAADCLEHIIPVLEKVLSEKRVVEQLKYAIQAIREDQKNSELLFEAAIRAIAIKEGKSIAGRHTAAVIATLARDFAFSPEDEMRWQAERYEERRQADG